MAALVGIETAAEDILKELYWYILRDRGTKPDDLLVIDIVQALQHEGILFWRDERFQESQDLALEWAHQTRTAYTGRICTTAMEEANQVALDYTRFVALVAPSARLFLKPFSEELVIPDWPTFTADMAYHFHEASAHTDGANANYIPLLRDANSDQFALGICSTDGQRFSLGDSHTTFTLQSVSKPVTYALCLAQEGEAYMDEWINVEPAGRPFNTQDLDPTNRPFNAAVNSGAILAAGVFGSNFPDYTWREVVDQVRAKWYELCGNDLDVGFSQETYESEKSCAFNNFAIAYNLRGRKGLPRDIDLHKMLDIYLGCCSLELTTEALSVAAATLANGGVCPITGKEVFPAHVTRTVLSEMMTCGMYDQAGRFVVEVGLPSKSGVSGALMVIIPNLLGIAVFSPRLNEKGNSVRGIEFCKRLVQSYRVHLFEPLRSGNTGAKVDPRENGWKNERSAIGHMAWAVQVGDKYALRLRDLFLFALCTTAMASKEGLTDRMMELIRLHYFKVYQAEVDETLLENVVHAVRESPSDLRFIENLVKDFYVEDSLRSILIASMIDLIFADNEVDEHEKSVALRIAVLLGIDKNVALMELNRFEKKVSSHRLRDIEFCDMIDAIDLDVSRHKRSLLQGTSPPRGLLLGRSTSAQMRRATKNGKLEGIRSALGQIPVVARSDQEENLELRREILRLHKKLDKLTAMMD